MRMDRSSPLSAYDVVNGYPESELRRIFYEYGEEPNAPKIARAIVEKRSEKPIETTFELVDVIKSVASRKALAEGHHPAKQAFQAIRIEVNGELSIIAPAIEDAIDSLAKGGRIAVLTFHSLEDRAVKQIFARLEKGCTCPLSFPVCVCGKKPQIKTLQRKPILPSEEELKLNRRSHSAKLRVAEKYSKRITERKEDYELKPKPKLQNSKKLLKPSFSLQKECHIFPFRYVRRRRGQI